MINQRFDLDYKQLEKRHLLFESIKESDEIKEFVRNYMCPLDVIEENAYRFKRWIDEKREAEAYSIDDLKDNPEKGDYIDLRYDADLKILEEFVTRSEASERLEESLQYLDNYLEFDLPENFHKAQFEHLAKFLKEENGNYKKLYKNLVEFCDNNVLGYYIYGDLGVGKSYLSACVSNDFAKANKKVMFSHVPSLLNKLKLNFGKAYDNENILNAMKRVPLLVLDDLGAETITSWSRDEILLSVMNDRLENKRKTIITGNYKLEDLKDLYALDNKGTTDVLRARRLVERIQALCVPYELVGENRRKA